MSVQPPSNPPSPRHAADQPLPLPGAAGVVAASASSLSLAPGSAPVSVSCWDNFVDGLKWLASKVANFFYQIFCCCPKEDTIVVQVDPAIPPPDAPPVVGGASIAPLPPQRLRPLDERGGSVLPPPVIVQSGTHVPRPIERSVEESKQQAAELEAQRANAAAARTASVATLLGRPDGVPPAAPAATARPPAPAPRTALAQHKTSELAQHKTDDRKISVAGTRPPAGEMSAADRAEIQRIHDEQESASLALALSLEEPTPGPTRTSHAQLDADRAAALALEQNEQHALQVNRHGARAAAARVAPQLPRPIAAEHDEHQDPAMHAAMMESLAAEERRLGKAPEPAAASNWTAAAPPTPEEQAVLDAARAASIGAHLSKDVQELTPLQKHNTLFDQFSSLKEVCNKPGVTDAEIAKAIDLLPLPQKARDAYKKLSTFERGRFIDKAIKVTKLEADHVTALDTLFLTDEELTAEQRVDAFKNLKPKARLAVADRVLEKIKRLLPDDDAAIRRKLQAQGFSDLALATELSKRDAKKNERPVLTAANEQGFFDDLAEVPPEVISKWEAFLRKDQKAGKLTENQKCDRFLQTNPDIQAMDFFKEALKEAQDACLQQSVSFEQMILMPLFETGIVPEDRKVAE